MIKEQFEPIDMDPLKTRVINLVVDFSRKSIAQLQSYIVLLLPVMRPMKTAHSDQILSETEMADLEEKQASAKRQLQRVDELGPQIDIIGPGDMVLVQPLYDDPESLGLDPYTCSCIAVGTGKVAVAHFSRRAWLNATVIDQLAFFSKMPVFSGLETHQLQKLAASAMRRQLKCGQVNAALKCFQLRAAVGLI